MALVFPSSASIGQTYSSGSSSTYTWNGTYWQVSAISPTSSLNPQTASYAPVIRKNISYVSPLGTNGYTMFLADGVVYMSKASDGTLSWYLSTLNPSGSAGTAMAGFAEAFPITFPNESGSIVSASMQGASCYVLFDNGNLYSWGENGQGQLGLGDTTVRYMPTLTNTGVAHIYTHPSSFDYPANYTGVYIRKTDGSISYTGYNGANNFGNGNTTNATSWTTVNGLGLNPRFLARIGNYDGGTIAQKADGTVVVAGRNNYNFLGINNSSANITTFTTASGWLHSTSSFTMSAVYGGTYYQDGSNVAVSSMIVLLTSGSTKKLMACGYNNWGNLGTGNTTNVSTPTPVLSTFNHNTISKISSHGGPVQTVHVLTTTGSVWAWGYNNYGQVGDGSTTDRPTPKLVLTGAVDMYITDETTHRYCYATPGPLIKKTDGTYVSSGDSLYGQLGNGSTTATNALSLSSSAAVIELPSNTNLKFGGVTTPTGHNGVVRYVVTNENRLYAWGINDVYTIAPGANTAIPVPVEVTPNAFCI